MEIVDEYMRINVDSFGNMKKKVDKRSLKVLRTKTGYYIIRINLENWF